MNRAEFVSRGAKAGAALVVAGAALGPLVRTAVGDPLPTGDLAYARLLVGAELLSSDFYGQAVAAANSKPHVLAYLKRARTNELEHYESVAGILTGAGAVPAVAADIDFSYPKGAFASEGSILKLARQLETLLLGTYLGAVGGTQTVSLKQGLAQIAACEAQHLSYASAATGNKVFSVSFPPALTIDQASTAMDGFTS